MTAKEGTGNTALVTGASAGIGVALAEEFAARGFDLVLTARRKDRLEAVASDLSARHNVNCRTLVADLADPAAPAAIKAELDAAGLKIDALINNAGYADEAKFLDLDWPKQERLLMVMGTGVLALTHQFMPGMLARDRGWILNVSSLAGLLYGSGLYGSVKAMVIHFTQTMALEALDHDVKLSVLCPGYTYSEFHDVMGNRERIHDTVPPEMWMTAGDVAKAGVGALMDGRVVCVPGEMNRNIAGMLGHLPDDKKQAAMEQFRRERMAANADPG